MLDAHPVCGIILGMSKRTIILATRNRHKVDELRVLLGGGIDWLNLTDFPAAPAIIEDATTFEGNAAKKAVGLAEHLRAISYPNLGVFVLADDSGLEVDALGGAPGVYSARFAYLDTGEQGNAPDRLNNAKLLQQLGKLPAAQHTARFWCVLALQPLGDPKSPLPKPIMFDGKCEGSILSAPQGEAGFGYDPLFVPHGYTESFAQLGETVKNSLSHRGHAAKLLAAWLASNR